MELLTPLIKFLAIFSVVHCSNFNNHNYGPGTKHLSYENYRTQATKERQFQLLNYFQNNNEKLTSKIHIIGTLPTRKRTRKTNNQPEPASSKIKYNYSKPPRNYYHPQPTQSVPPPGRIYKGPIMKYRKNRWSEPKYSSEWGYVIRQPASEHADVSSYDFFVSHV